MRPADRRDATAARTVVRPGADAARPVPYTTIKISVLRSDERGSALIWAMMVLAVLSILVTAALTLGFSYHARSVSSNTARQAYFSARSTANAVAVDIANGNENFLPAAGGSDVVIDSVQYPESANMGDCSAVVKRVNDAKVQVTGTAVYAGATDSVTVDLVQKYSEIKTFSGGALVLNSLAGFKSVNGDVYYDGGQKITIDYPITGSLFAPNAAVEVLSSGSVSGTILAQSCNYRATGILPEVIVVESKALSAVLPANTVVVEVPDIGALLTSKDATLVVPESYYHLPDGFDEQLFATDRAPVVVESSKNNADFPAVTAAPDSMVYCVVPNIVSFKSMTFDGGGTIFVAVAENMELAVKSLSIADDTTVYFLLNDNAKFSLEETKSNEEYIVYGKASSVFKLKNKAVMRGELVVGSLEIQGGHALDYTAGSTLTGTEETILIPAGWQIAQYEDGTQ